MHKGKKPRNEPLVLINKGIFIFLFFIFYFFMKSCFLPTKDLGIFQDEKNPTQFSFFFFFSSEEMTQALPSTFPITMVDYQLFIMMGSDEPIYHWTVKRNEEKKIKLFGM